MKKSFIVDVSSVLWTGLFSGEDKEFGRVIERDGRKVKVASASYGYDNASKYIISMMEMVGCRPTDIILVTDGKLSKAKRLAVYPEYKGGKDSRVPEQYDEFNKAKGVLIGSLREVGAQWAWQDGVEADDIISYLAKKLSGDRYILSEDGDLAVLIADGVTLLRKGTTVTQNPYGPFPSQFINVYKALVGQDTSDNIKGAKGFGPQAWLDFLAWGENDSILAAIEGLIKRRELHTLEDDVKSFKPFRKVIDDAENVYRQYYAACVYPEWVNTKLQPLNIEPPLAGATPTDFRLKKYAADKFSEAAWVSEVKPKPKIKNHAIYDVELIGKERPVFLFCAKIVETGKRFSFWMFETNDHDPGHVNDIVLMKEFLKREDLTYVSFNGNHFDVPVIAAAIDGKGTLTLKSMAGVLTDKNNKTPAYKMPDLFNYEKFDFDHIDLFNVVPGVQISLKTYAGRMGYPTMMDMPFHHDHDLSDDELPVVETYCQNDLGVTEWLFERQKVELALRVDMSEEYGVDLRSKSDAQISEAVMRKVVGIGAPDSNWDNMPAFVTFRNPPFIQTDSPELSELIERFQRTQFVINRASGKVESPDYLEEPIELGHGRYKVGVGGLHSQHDVNLYRVAEDDWLISDFDVAGYYPDLILAAGLTPKIKGKGENVIVEYRKIRNKRHEYKRAGNKQKGNSLKTVLNGFFGQTSNPYSAFYAPELMLGTTLIGQLNLLSLIYDVERRPEIKVLSANTDGIAVMYHEKHRGLVLNTVLENAKRTGFTYEETRYTKIAMKDVNNYFAVTAAGDSAIISAAEGVTLTHDKGGKVKRKGLYASNNPKENPLYLMKNPTMQVCSNMVADYLRDGVLPEDNIANYTDIRDYVEIRNVKGGGIQYDSMVEVDDWIMVQDCELVDDWVEINGEWYSLGADKSKKSKKRPGPIEVGERLWRRPSWPDDKASKSRKSRPDPVMVGVGGTPFGRVARWYMTTQDMPPISYEKSGNRVAGTAGGRILMNLPDSLPEDLDRQWYIDEAYNILADCGVMERRNAHAEVNEDADKTAVAD